MILKTRFEPNFDNKNIKVKQDISIDEILNNISKTTIIAVLRDGSTEFLNEQDVFVDNLFIKNWFYKEASSPSEEVISEVSELQDILKQQKAGNILEIWVLSENPKYFIFTCPDENGMVPVRGSY